MLMSVFQQWMENETGCQFLCHSMWWGYMWWDHLFAGTESSTSKNCPLRTENTSTEVQWKCDPRRSVCGSIEHYRTMPFHWQIPNWQQHDSVSRAIRTWLLLTLFLAVVIGTFDLGHVFVQLLLLLLLLQSLESILVQWDFFWQTILCRVNSKLCASHVRSQIVVHSVQLWCCWPLYVTDDDSGLMLVIISCLLMASLICFRF